MINQLNRKIPRKLRLFSLSILSSLLLSIGGLGAVYALLFFYVASPGGASPEVIRPFNVVILTILTHPIFVGFISIIIPISVLEIKSNGFLKIDDRILAERKKDMRREKAKENPAWEPPEEDEEQPSEYEELKKSLDPNSDDVEQQEKQTNDNLTEITSDPDNPVIIKDKQLTKSDNRPSAKGKLYNVSSSTQRDIKLQIGFVDKNGNIDQTIPVTKKQLKPKNEYQFQVFYSGDNRIETCKFSDVKHTEVT
jgi:hypothetical protein